MLLLYESVSASLGSAAALHRHRAVTDQAGHLQQRGLPCFNRPIDQLDHGNPDGLSGPRWFVCTLLYIHEATPQTAQV